jgi:hypothetical protein
LRSRVAKDGTKTMNPQVNQRRLGLSPRARRVVIPVFVTALLLIAIGTRLTQADDAGGGSGPVVGNDLHAVALLSDRVFVGGHAGAGYRPQGGGWTQIPSLDDKDVMAWARSGANVLAGGHGGLYASSDDGDSFTRVPDVPVSDVHGVGAAGEVVYVASPETGVLASTDGGKTFAVRSDAGRDFMGTIWVDPANADVAVAPSMQEGAVKTTDGGRSWSSLGSGSGSMAVAVDQSGTNLVALGMDGAQQSSDGGATWSPLVVPDGTVATSYDTDGQLIVAVLSGDRATVFRQAGGEWDRLT